VGGGSATKNQLRHTIWGLVHKFCGKDNFSRGSALSGDAAGFSVHMTKWPSIPHLGGLSEGERTGGGSSTFGEAAGFLVPNEEIIDL